MELVLDPDPGVELTGRLAVLAHDESHVTGRAEAAYTAPWRLAALSEGVERSAGPVAVVPRSSRGATRA